MAAFACALGLFLGPAKNAAAEFETPTFVVRADHPGAARAILDEGNRALPRIERDLGARVARPIEIRVARDSAEMRRLAPPGRPPPGYAIGVAYPEEHLLLVSLTSPQTGAPTDLGAVLRHELVHLVTFAATGGRPLPRWFAEGVAIEFSNEQSTARTEALWSATIRGRLLPLSSLGLRFPANERKVNLAYAQSADFVRYLWREGGRGRFRGLLGAVREGATFDEALGSSFSASVGRLERDWRADLGRRFRVLPALTATSVVYALITALLALAVIRHRSRKQRKLERMAIEDQIQDLRDAEDDPSGAPPNVMLH